MQYEKRRPIFERSFSIKIVFMKTDALSIVLRKWGGNEEFLELMDKLKGRVIEWCIKIV